MKPMRFSVRLLFLLPLLITRMALAECTFGWATTDLSSASPGGNVRAMTIYGGKLVVAGEFTSIGGVSALRIATWDGSQWEPLGSGVNGTVFALKTFNDELIVGGGFSDAGGVLTNDIARWNGSTWMGLGAGTSPPAATVNALTVHNGSLVIGGNFDGVDLIESPYVARWDGATWHAMTATPTLIGPVPSVTALASFEGQLFVGGFFNYQSTCFNLIIWNGSDWSPIGSGANASVSTLDVLQYDSPTPSLFVGGQFATLNGTTVNRIARYGSPPEAFGGGIDGTTTSVSAIAVYDDKLTVGGAFTLAFGMPVSRIARWSGTAWEPLGLGTGASVIDFVEYDGQLVVGGSFTTAGGNATPRLAVWRPVCPRADMNCDLLVNADDVPFFVDALLNSPALNTCTSYTANVSGDVNADGTPRVDGSDIGPFLTCVVAGGCP